MQVNEKCENISKKTPEKFGGDKKVCTFASASRMKGNSKFIETVFLG
jgi:hypothetical protein